MLVAPVPPSADSVELVNANVDAEPFAPAT